jgi:hypothetical protein
VANPFYDVVFDFALARAGARSYPVRPSGMMMSVNSRSIPGSRSKIANASGPFSAARTR